MVDTAQLPREGWDDPSRGSVVWQTVFSAERTPTGSLTVGIAELAPDGTVGNPPHRHAPAETYFVIAGDGVVMIDGEEHAVHPGYAVFIPGGAEHSLRCTGSSPLRILYTFPTDSFDDVTYVFSNDLPG